MRRSERSVSFLFFNCLFRLHVQPPRGFNSLRCADFQYCLRRLGRMPHLFAGLCLRRRSRGEIAGLLGHAKRAQAGGLFIPSLIGRVDFGDRLAASVRLVFCGMRLGFSERRLCPFARLAEGFVQNHILTVCSHSRLGKKKARRMPDFHLNSVRRCQYIRGHRHSQILILKLREADQRTFCPTCCRVPARS